MFETLDWFGTYLCRRAGVMKRSSILSQNWFPGKLSIAMYAKYPHRTDVGIFLITGIANTDAATSSDCNRLLTLCSLTRTGKYGSISFSGSKVSLFFLPSSSFSTTAFFKLSNSFSTVACLDALTHCYNTETLKLKQNAVCKRTHDWRAVQFYEHSLHLSIDLRIASFLLNALFGTLNHLPPNQLIAKQKNLI